VYTITSLYFCIFRRKERKNRRKLFKTYFKVLICSSYGGCSFEKHSLFLFFRHLDNIVVTVWQQYEIPSKFHSFYSNLHKMCWVSLGKSHYKLIEMSEKKNRLHRNFIKFWYLDILKELYIFGKNSLFCQSLNGISCKEFERSLCKVFYSVCGWLFWYSFVSF